MTIRNVTTGGDRFTNGVNLQNEINAATFGDEIVTTVGAEYSHPASQPFLLPNKGAGTSPIIIRTNNMSLIPSGTRVGLADLAKLARCSTDDSFPVFEVAIGAHHWTLQGLDITTTENLFPTGRYCTGLINHIDWTHTAGGPYQHHITYDRCVAHPLETAMTQHFRAAQRGGIFGGANITFVDSSFTEFGGWAHQPHRMSDGGVATYGLDYRTWLVTGATNANPCVVTLNGVAGNNVLIADGTGGTTNSLNKRPIAFEGWVGAGTWATLNTTLCIEYVDSTHGKLQYFDLTTGAKTNVDSTGWPAFGAQTPVRLETGVVNSTLNDASAYLDTVGPGPTTVTNCLFKAGTYCWLTGGGGSYVPTQNDTTVTAAPAIDTVVLAELGDLQVGDVISFGTSVPQPISFASSATQCVITVPTHRFLRNKRLGPGHNAVRIRGATGAWAGLNGEWLGRANDSTHIRLAGNQAFTGDALYFDETPFNTTGFPAPSGSDLTGATWKVTGPLVRSGIAGTEDVTPMTGRVTAINVGTKTVTYAFQSNGGFNYSNGNGAGIPVAVGSTARHNGLGPDGYTVTQCDFVMDRFWFWLLRDRCKTVTLTGSGPKGMWECKWATNVEVEGCRWGIGGGPMGQDDLGDDITGIHCVTFNQVDQNGTTPWVSVSNWRVRYCLVYNGSDLFVGHKDEIYSSAQSQNFVMEHCLFTSAKGNYAGYHIDTMNGLTIRHCTFRNGRDAFALIGQTTNNIIKDNIYCLGQNGYLYHADLTDEDGVPYLGWQEDSAHVNNNYIIDNRGMGAGTWTGSKYANDHFVASEAEMGFVNLAAADAGGDYHLYALAPGSPGKGQSVTEPGYDVGVRFDLLDAALAGDEPPGGGGGSSGSIFLSFLE